MAASNLAPEAALADQHPSEAAYLALLPEISAVPGDKLVPINIDVLASITTVLGALPEIRAMRAQFDAAFRDFDFARYDKLEQYTLALNHAHTRWRGASTSKGALAEQGAELAVIRDRLFDDAKALAGRDLIDGERLKECKTAPGYRPIASDVLTIVTLIKERWQTVSGKTAVTLPELNAHAALALELLSAVGLKEQAPAQVGEAALLRQKAFYLFLRAYEHVRRAVQYVRGEAGDADDITPSLYAGRVARKRDGEQQEAPADGDTSVPPPEPPAAAAQPGFRFDPGGLPVTHPFPNDTN